MVEPTRIDPTPHPHACDECGAPVTYVAGSRTVQCSRWSNHQAEIPPIDQAVRAHPYEQWSGRELVPDAVLPFKLDRNAALERLRVWLTSLRFAPNRLREVTGADSLTGTYVPHWAFSASTTTDYTGRRGRHYYTTSTHTTTDAQGNSSTHTTTHQHTSWKDARGTVAREFRDLLVLATERVDPKLLDKVAPWPTDQAVPFRPEFGYGYRSVSYDVDPDRSLDRVKETMAKAIKHDCENDIGGDAQRVDRVETVYRDVSYTYLLFPAWIGSYRLGEKRWQLIVNGATGTVDGDRPYSVVKIASTWSPSLPRSQRWRRSSCSSTAAEPGAVTGLRRA